MAGRARIYAPLALATAFRRSAIEVLLSCFLSDQPLVSAASIESFWTDEGCLSAAWGDFCARMFAGFDRAKQVSRSRLTRKRTATRYALLAATGRKTVGSAKPIGS